MRRSACGMRMRGATIAVIELFLSRKGRASRDRPLGAVLTTLFRSLPARVLNRLAPANRSQRPCCVRTPVRVRKGNGSAGVRIGPAGSRGTLALLSEIARSSRLPEWLPELGSNQRPTD
jgi:hypothetical protein